MHDVVRHGLVFVMWPRLGSIDDLMIKAHYLGVRVIEMNVFARMRGNGLSHVRASTRWEFLTNLLRFAFSRQMARWRRERVGSVGAQAASSTPRSGA